MWDVQLGVWCGFMLMTVAILGEFMLLVNAYQLAFMAVITKAVPPEVGMCQVIAFLLIIPMVMGVVLVAYSLWRDGK